MSRAGVLFSTYAWDTVLDAQRRVLRAQIQALGMDYLRARDIDSLAAVLADEHVMNPPKVFAERITVAPGAACGDPAYDFALLRAAVSQDAVFQARLPFEGDPGMFAVSPLARPGAPPPGRIGEGFVELTLAGSGLSPDVVMDHACRWSDIVQAWLVQQARSVGGHAGEMRRVALAAIRHRLEELSAEENLWAGLEMLKRQPAA